MEPRPTFPLSLADGTLRELGTHTWVMGIVNATPDSFSDGGRFADSAAASDAALDMARAGADIVDVGGESTRPGADPVPVDEELRRVLPVIEAIKARSEVLVSVDTRRAPVARQAVEAGADMINDVSAGEDPEMFGVAAETKVPLALMHMRGQPATMQRDTHYDDLLGEIADYLGDRAEKATKAGVADAKILLDPGIGFGKSVRGNLSILRCLGALRRLGKPLLVGASRKTFIGKTLDLPVEDRLEGSLAVAALAAWNGAHVIRAHDVDSTLRTVRMVDAVRNS